MFSIVKVLLNDFFCKNDKEKWIFVLLFPITMMKIKQLLLLMIVSVVYYRCCLTNKNSIYFSKEFDLLDIPTVYRSAYSVEQLRIFEQMKTVTGNKKSLFFEKPKLILFLLDVEEVHQDFDDCRVLPEKALFRPLLQQSHTASTASTTISSTPATKANAYDRLMMAAAFNTTT